MRRYDPAYLAAKREIEAGTIGTPVFLKTRIAASIPKASPAPARRGP